MTIIASGGRPATSEKQRGDPRTLSLLVRPSLVRRVLLGIVVWLAFFLAWIVIVDYTRIPAVLMPLPQSIAKVAISISLNEGFLWDVLASLRRIFVSFLLTSIVGIPLGILMGSFKSFEAMLNPSISAWRYLPAAAFVPILLMWLGTGEAPKIALLYIGVIFFQITIMMDMTKAIPRPLLETAMTLVHPGFRLPITSSLGGFCRASSLHLGRP